MADESRFRGAISYIRLQKESPRVKSSMDVNNRRILAEIVDAREKLPNRESLSALPPMKAPMRHDNWRSI